MRFSPLLTCMVLSVVCSSAASATAQDASSLADRRAARRELELAKMDLRHYWQVEYPRQQRFLIAAIELTKAEVQDLQLRLREYQPYTRFSTGDPFMITIQNTRTCLREAELRLRELWRERSALTRFHSDQWRVLEMRVHEARLRVAELESAEELEVSTVADRPVI
jgi:hypothetical protein